jgi:hypothetical protein
MGITLKLDRAALDALFPEGSEARAELVSGAKAEFLKGHVKAAWVGVDKDLEDKLRTMANMKVQTTLDSEVGTWDAKLGAVRLTTSCQAALTRYVHDQIAAAVREAAESVTARAIAQIRDDMAFASRNAITAEVRKRVAAALDEALKAQG